MQVVVRNGVAISARLPDYSQLDYSIQDTSEPVSNANLSPTSATSRQTAVQRSGSSMLSQCAAALYTAVQRSAGSDSAPVEGIGAGSMAAADAGSWQPSWGTVTAAVAAGVIAGYLCCNSVHMRTGRS